MNKLARYIIIVAICAIVCFLAWYFSSVLVYILVSAVIALIGKPLMRSLRKIKIKKFQFPSWLASIITLIIICGVFFSIFFLLTPLVGEMVSKFSSLDLNQIGSQISEPLQDFNILLRKTFPTIGEDFRVEMYTLEQLRESFSFSRITNMVNGITSFIVDFGVAIFSILFISFFFLMEDGLFTKMIVSVFPEKYEQNINRASKSISSLLSRYFLGISIESILVALLNSIGLIFIAKMPISLAIVIGAATGIFNVIPYVGPLMGDLLAVLMGIVIHFGSVGTMSLGIYVLIVLAICIVTQLIDNYVFQPLIYSNSVKAHPLEIFIVILMAGHIGGVLGMLIAIPTYTVLRVFAREFLSNLSFVKKLTKSLDDTNK